MKAWSTHFVAVNKFTGSMETHPWKPVFAETIEEAEAAVPVYVVVDKEIEVTGDKDKNILEYFRNAVVH